LPLFGRTFIAFAVNDFIDWQLTGSHSNDLRDLDDNLNYFKIEFGNPGTFGRQ
jgi:hypothetical protein